MSSIIAGLYPPFAGTMTWEGQPYAPVRPGEAVEAGIVLIHQEMRLLPQLSIAETVFVGLRSLASPVSSGQGARN
jgi:ribose transport system ATP-binding protein